MFKQKILEDLKKVVEDLGYQGVDPVLSIPKNPQFGDYTSNVPLQLAKLKSVDGKQTVFEIANKIARKLKKQEYLEKVEVKGSGFLNLFLKSESLMDSLQKVCDYSAMVDPQIRLEGHQPKKIMIEFGQPNTHKPIHVGHIRNFSLGESIARLQEALGYEVYRANYQGDIGLHVAKALWGLLHLASEMKVAEKSQDPKKRADFLGKAYSKGAMAYEDDEKAKQEIYNINLELYSGDAKVKRLWQKTRKWSLDYFDSIYKKLGVQFDGLFFESEVAERGKELVKEHLDKIFVEDQGAVIFRGEDYGLHNRVFINQNGIPTYEAKDLGLAKLQWESFPFDLAIHVVGQDQAAYFSVMFKALELIDQRFAGKEMFFGYGMVNLKTGKMSSRSGEVVIFDWLFEQIKKKIGQIMEDSKETKQISSEERKNISDMVALGAIKFSMLKVARQTDIIFDIEKSVSLEGDSGPYLQYSYARAKSVLRNAQYDYDPISWQEGGAKVSALEKEEREILQTIEYFEPILEDTAKNFAPNTLATFLLVTAKIFNLFYQKHPIIKAGGKSQFRLALTCAVAVILKQGLYLLGIEAPERM